MKENDKKGKYELIIGFVTLVISLSAFKDELNMVDLNFGSFTFTLGQYLLWIVYGFCICLYLYVTDGIFKDTKIGNLRIFQYSVYFGYWLFVMILLTPLLLLFTLIFYRLWKAFSSLGGEQLESIKTILIIGISVIGGFTSGILTTKKFRADKERIIEENEEKEIVALGNARKLLSDGYYSHSILESFKAVQVYISKSIISKNLRHTNRMRDNIDLAVIHGILNDEEHKKVILLMDMRNTSAHTSIEYSESDARLALTMVESIISKVN